MASLSASEALPSFREILNAGFKDRKVILITMISAIVVFVLIAVVTPKKYEASASLLVLPSTDYATQADTGTNVEAASSLSRTEILPTEIEILSSSALHEAVIRKIGLANVYPKLVQPPGLIAKAIGGVKSSIKAVLVACGIASADDKGAPDPVQAAVPLFDDDLSLLAQKEGSIIQISYRNPDADIAKQTLNTLIALYIDKRHALYANTQSEMIAQQVESLRAQLEGLDQTTAKFKLEHSVYDFAAQRTLLINRRGDISKDLDDARSVIAQLNHRIPEIQLQLAHTPVDVTLYSEADYDVRTAELRTGLNTLITQKATLLTQFKPDSRPIKDINNQIATVEEAVRKANGEGDLSAKRVGRNANYDIVSADLARAQEDLRAAEARRDTDLTQLAAIGDQLERLSADEAELETLDRQSKVAEASYEDAIKRYDLHKEIEDVSQRRAANVRQIEPAVTPQNPSSLTIPLIGGGIAVGLILSILVALISEARRPGIISPEKLERALGLKVLVSVPETPFIGESAI